MYQCESVHTWNEHNPDGSVFGLRVQKVGDLGDHSADPTDRDAILSEDKGRRGTQELTSRKPAALEYHQVNLEAIELGDGLVT
jgi:hypothetical protein